MICPVSKSAGKFGRILLGTEGRSIFALLLLLGFGNALATSYTWNGGASGAWGTNTNWSPSGVPGAGDNITVNRAGGATILLNGSQSILNITLGDAGADVMTIQTGSSGTLTIASGGAVSTNASSTGTHVISCPVALSASMTTTVNNSSGTVDYQGIISGAFPLVAAGTGTVKLSAANTYTGNTTVNGGTLKLNNAAAMGGTSARATVSSGATLDLNGCMANADTVFIAGTGVGGNGAIINSDTDEQNGIRFLVMSADASIGGSKRFDVRYPSSAPHGGEFFNENSHTLTKSGSCQVTFSSVVVQNFNGIVVSGGTLGTEVNTAFPSGGTGISLQSGTTLFFYNTSGETAPLSMNNATIWAYYGNSGWGGTISLTGANTIQVDGDSGTLSGTISGTGSLTKTGANPLILTAANSYSGTTTISTGTLKLGIANAVPSGSDVTVTGTLDMRGYSDAIGALAGAGTVNNSTGSGTYTLDVGGSNNSGTFSGVLENTSGTIALTKSGTGTQTLSGTNTYNGATTVSAGTLQLGSTAALGSTPSVSVTSGAALDLDGQNYATSIPLTINGTGISNGGALLNSSGTAATWAGGITVASASSEGGSGNVTLSGAVTTSALTKVGSGTLTFSGTTDNNGLSLVANAGTVILAKTSSSTVHSIGGNGLTVGGATVRLGGSGGDQIYDGPLAVVVVNSGTLDLYGNSETITSLAGTGGVVDNTSGGGTYTLTAGGGNASTTYSGTIKNTSGSLALTKSGTGTMTLSGASTYKGATSVSAGTLQLGIANALPSGSAVTVSSGATLDLKGYSDLVGSLAGAGTVDDVSGGGTSTLSAGNDNTSTTFSGIIQNTSGTVALTKTGTGTLTLSGTNTFSGATTVNGGTLLVNGTDANSAVTVNTGAILGGTGTVAGVTVTSGVVQPGSSGSKGILTAASANFSGGTSSALDLRAAATTTAGTTYDRFVTSGTLTLNGTSVLNLDLTGFSGTGTFTGIVQAGTISGTFKTVNISNYTGTNSIKLYYNGSTSIDLVIGGGTAFTWTGTAGTSDWGTCTNWNPVGIPGSDGSITVNLAGAIIALNGNQSVTNVTLGDAGTDVMTIQQGSSGTLTIASGGSVATNASSTIANVISCPITLSSTLTTTVNNSSGAVDYQGAVGGGYGMTVAGTGTVKLSTTNGYTGTTTVSAGTLKLNSTGAVSSSSGVSVTAGAVLDVNGLNYSTAIPLTLNGTGIASGGALVNSNATGATWAGLITLGSASSIIGGTGSINVSAAGTIAGSGYGLTLGGAQGGTLTSILGTGAGTLTKQDAGTWTLSGTNTYTGATSVSAGVLKVNNTAAFGATTGITVSSGAAIDLNGSTYAVARPLTLNGTGITSGGALLNSSATGATWPGLITLGSASSIIGGTGTINLSNTSTVVGGGFGLTLGGTQGGTLASILSSTTASLTKQDAGTWTLTGANTYTGTTTISAGKIKLGVANALPSGSAVTVTSTLDMNTYSDVIGSLAGGGTVDNVAGGGTPTLAAGGDNTSTTFSGKLQNTSGTLSFTKNGSGTLTLSGANTYTGTTTISAGKIKLGVANALPSGSAVTVTGTLDMNTYSDAIGSLAGAGTVDNVVGAGTPTLTVGGNNSSTTFSGVLQNTTGALALTKSGSGTFTLSGTNTYSGATSVSAGILQVGNTAALGSTSGVTVISGAAVDLNGQNYATSIPLTLNGTGIASGGALINSSATGATYAGLITLGSASSIIGGIGTINVSNTTTLAGGTFGLTLGGAQGGTLASILSSTTASLTKQDAGTWTLTGANTYTGTTTISAGKIKLGVANALPSGSAVTVTGTLDMNTYSDAIGSLAGGGTVDNVSGAGTPTLTVGGDNTNTTFSGALQNTTGNLALTKTGTGALTLSGTNTYTGATTVSAGTLLVTGSLASGSAVTVSNTATLSGNGTAAGTVSVASGATLAPGSATGVSIATLNTGAVTFVSGSTYSVDLNGTTPTFDKLNVTGTATLGNATLTVASIANAAVNKVYTIVSATSVSGTFLGLANGSIFSQQSRNFQITYTSTTVTLTDVTGNVNGTKTWTGGGTDANWTTAANWGGTAPLPGDNLVFAGVTNLSPNNDYAAGTSFGSISFSSGSGTFVVGGNALTLTGGATALVSNAVTGTMTVNNNLTFSTAAPTISSASGGTLTLGGTVANGGLLVTAAATGAINLSGNLSGGGGLTKTAAGTLTVSGANSYSGATTVSAGTLQLGSNGALGSTSGVLVTAGAVLDLNGQNYATLIPLTLNGTGIASGGALINSNATGATYAGLITLGGASSIIGGTGTINISNTTTIAGGTFGLTLGGAQGGTLASILSSTTASLTKQDAGTWTLTSANTYTGTTTISAGKIKLGVANALPSGSAVTVTGTLDMNTYSDAIGSLAGAGTVDNVVGAGTPTLTVGGNNTSTTFSGVLQNTTGALSLTKSGSGTLTLSGANTYSGTTTVSAGTLKLNNTAALGSSTGVSVTSGAVLDLNGQNYSTSIPLTLNGTGIASGGALINGSATGATYAGLITLGSASSIIGGTGTINISNTTTLAGGTFGLTLGGAQGGTLASILSSTTASLTKQDAGTWTLTGANTYTGTTTISAGKIKLGVANALPSGSAVTVTGTLDMNTYSDAIGSLAGGGTVDNVSGAGTPTLTVGGDNTSTTFSGAVQNTSGNLALTKTGTGALTLSGTNTYTGATTVSAGTLLVTGSLASGSAVTVSNTATLSGNGTAAGTVSVASGATLAPGSATGVSIATLNTGAVTFVSGSTYSVDLNGTTPTFDKLNVTGTATLGSATLTVASIANAAVNKVYTIVSATSVSGTFNGLSNGSTFAQQTRTFQITYTSTTVTLTDVTGVGNGTKTWTGAGTDNNWSTAANWGGTAPLPGDNLVFAGSTRPNPNNDYSAGTSFGSISFSSGSGTFVVGGNALTLTGGATALANNATSNTMTVNNNLTFSTAAPTISSASGGTLTLGGTVANGGLLVTAAATGTINLSGNLSGAGGLTKTAAGTLTVSGANSYNGATTVSAGTLQLGSTGALGSTSGVSVTSGAVLDLNGQNYATSIPLTLNGTGIASGGALINSSATGATYAGLLTLGSASSILGGTGTINLSNAGTITGAGFGLTLGGAQGGTLTSILGTGAGTLIKQDAGTWTLSGANTYTGATTVSAGTLKLNNTSALGSSAGVSVTSGAVLDLNGQNYATPIPLTINGTGIASGGALINSSATGATYAGLVTLGSASSILGGTGTISLSNAGTITGSGFGLTLGGAQGGTLASILGTGAGTLTKQDAGTWTLTGASTYTGATSVGAGTLKIGVANAIPSGSAVTVTGTLDMNTFSDVIGSLAGGGTIDNVSGAGTPTLTAGADNTSTTFSGVLQNTTGSLTLTKSGTGTLTLSGTNTYSGATTVSAGTLQLGSTAALGSTSGVSVTSGAVLDLNGINYSTARALTLNGTGIASGGALINSNATGATYAGLVTLGSASSILGGTGTINLSNAGTITGAGFGLTLGGAQGGTLASILGTGAGTLTKQDAGTWTLSGANTFSGATTVSAGTLKLNNTAALGSSTGVSVTSGAVLDLNGQNYATSIPLTLNGTGIATGGALINSNATGATYAGLITLGSASSILGGTGTINLSNAGTIAGSGYGLTLGGAQGGTLVSILGTGAGTLTKQDAGTWTLSGANTYTGTTTISAGKLKVGVANAIPSTSAVTVTGTLDLNGFSDAIGSLAGGGTVDNGSGAGTYTLTEGADNTSTAFSGAIQNTSGTVALTKSGTGTLSLSGTNTFSGATTVSAGTLLVNGADASSAVTVNSGATLGGTGTAAGVTVTSGLVQPGSASKGILTAASANFAGGASSTLDLRAAAYTTAGTDYDRFKTSGAITLGGSSVLNLDLTGISGMGTITGVVQATGGITGTFATVNILNYVGSNSVQVVYNGTSIDVVISGSASYTWTGSVDSDWGKASNWSPAGVPGANDNITVNKAGGATIALNGNRGVTNITLGDAGADAMTIQQGSSGTLTISSGGAVSTNAGSTIANVISCPVTLSSALTTTVGNANGTVDYQGAVGGAFGMTIAGPGTVKLSTTNTFSGATTVSSGTLKLGSTGAVSSSSGISVTSGAVLDLNGQNYATAKALTLNGTGIASGGALINSSATGATWAGLVTLGSASSILGGTGTINVSNVAAIVGGTFGLTLGGAAGGTLTSILNTSMASLTKQDAGTWTLSGANTYTGTTTISAGKLKVGVANAIPSTSAVTVTGTLDLNGFSDAVGSLTGGGTVDNGSGAGTYTLTAGADNTSTTFSGAIQNTSGSVALTKSGSGTLTLSGINTFSGATTVSAGTLLLNSTSALGASSGVSVTSGAVLDLNGQNYSTSIPLTLNGTGIATSGALINSNATGATYAGLVTLGSASSILGGTGTINLSNAGTITGSGYGLTLGGAQGGTLASILGTGAGTLTKQDAGTWTLSGASTYTGTTTISAGKLKVGVANAIPSTSAVTVTGTLDLNGFSDAIGSLAGGGTVDNGSGAGTYTLTEGADNTSTAFSGAIQNTSGTVALTKSGTGTLTLSGTNTFSGATTVNAGTLLVNGTDANSAVTVNSGATLGGTGTAAGVTVTSGLVQPGSTGSKGILTAASANFAGGASSTLDLRAAAYTTAGTDYDRFKTSGAVTLGGSSVLNLDLTGLAGTGTITGVVQATGGVTGTFTTVNILNYAGSNSVQVVYNGTSIDVVISGSANYTWTGSVDSDWGKASNWSPAGVPGANDNITVNKAGGATIALNGHRGVTNITLGDAGANVMTIQQGSSGTLTISSGGAVSTNAGSTIANVISCPVTLSSALTTTVGNANGTVDYQGAVGGAFGMTIAGPGTVKLSATNTFSGATTVSSGTLKLGSTGAVSSSSGVSVTSGAVLDLNGQNYATAKALTLNGTGIASNGALINSSATGATWAGLITLGSASSILGGAGTINVSDAAAIVGGTFGLTLGGAAGGTLTSILNTSIASLTKQDGGTWTLSGANTYTGTTTISAGKLKVGVANAIPSTSAVTVTGTLDLNGFSDAIGSLAGGGTVDNGSGVGTYTLTEGADNTSTTFSGALQNTSGAVALTKSGIRHLDAFRDQHLLWCDHGECGDLAGERHGCLQRGDGEFWSHPGRYGHGGRRDGDLGLGAARLDGQQGDPDRSQCELRWRCEFHAGSARRGLHHGGDGLRPVQDLRSRDLGRELGLEPGPHGFVGNRHDHRGGAGDRRHHGDLCDGEHPELRGLELGASGVQREFDRRGDLGERQLHLDGLRRFGLGQGFELVPGRRSRRQRQHHGEQGRWYDHRVERKPWGDQHHAGRCRSGCDDHPAGNQRDAHDHQRWGGQYECRVHFRPGHLLSGHAILGLDHHGGQCERNGGLPGCGGWSLRDDHRRSGHGEALGHEHLQRRDHGELGDLEAQ
jgi:fibronectin-binding autotransporter adhesin